jgi:hypothetical protein
MSRFRLVSGPVPAASAPSHVWATLPAVYVGGVEGLRREFPRERFPQLTGIGHRVESPSKTEPTTHYLSLLQETENGWVPAHADPR